MRYEKNVKALLDRFWGDKIDNCKILLLFLHRMNNPAQFNLNTNYTDSLYYYVISKNFS